MIGYLARDLIVWSSFGKERVENIPSPTYNTKTVDASDNNASDNNHVKSVDTNPEAPPNSSPLFLVWNGYQEDDSLYRTMTLSGMSNN